jgi:hypothetical protein
MFRTSGEVTRLGHIDLWPVPRALHLHLFASDASRVEYREVLERQQCQTSAVSASKSPDLAPFVGKNIQTRHEFDTRFCPSVHISYYRSRRLSGACCGTLSPRFWEFP